MADNFFGRPLSVLCGCCIGHSYHHRDTENTEVAQRADTISLELDQSAGADQSDSYLCQSKTFKGVRI